MGCYHEPCNPEWRIESRRKRIELYNVMFTGNDRIFMSSVYCGMLVELAMALTEAGKTDESIAALSEAIDRYEEHKEFAESLQLDEDTKISFLDPMWNQLTKPAFPHKISTKFFKKLAEKPEYMQKDAFRKVLNRVSDWKTK